MVLSVMIYQYLTANGQFSNKSRMYYVKVINPNGDGSMQTPFPFLYEVMKELSADRGGGPISRPGTGPG